MNARELERWFGRGGVHDNNAGQPVAFAKEAQVSAEAIDDVSRSRRIPRAGPRRQPRNLPAAAQNRAGSDVLLIRRQVGCNAAEQRLVEKPAVAAKRLGRIDRATTANLVASQHDATDPAQVQIAHRGQIRHKTDAGHTATANRRHAHRHGGRHVPGGADQPESES